MQSTRLWGQSDKKNHQTEIIAAFMHWYKMLSTGLYFSMSSVNLMTLPCVRLTPLLFHSIGLLVIVLLQKGIRMNICMQTREI
jgi:lipoprotein signal peptidase